MYTTGGRADVRRVECFAKLLHTDTSAVAPKSGSRDGVSLGRAAQVRRHAKQTRELL